MDAKLNSAGWISEQMAGLRFGFRLLGGYTVEMPASRA